MKNFFTFFILLSVISFDIKGQSKVDIILSNLNQVNKKNRDLVKGEIKEIKLDTQAKTIEIDNSIIPLTNYAAKYLSVFNKAYKRNIQVVMFSCLSNEECIVNSRTLDKHPDVGFGFKSKSACLQFITLIKNLASALDLKH